MTSAVQVLAAEAPVPAAAATEIGAEHELSRSIGWLIQLRWLAVAGLGAALLVADVTGWVPRLTAPVATAAGLAGANLLLWLWHRRFSARAPAWHLPWMLFAQLHGDLVALSLILHWTGGVVNPFVMFCVFPVTIAAILLPGWMAIVCALSAFALVGGLVACEMAAESTPLPFGHGHQGLLDYLEHPAFTLALLTAAAMTLLGIVYFVHAVVSRHREAERSRQQHERIAQSRERLARVGVIAAGVAHSVRNPLHGIFNCLDLVRSSEQPGEARELLDLATEGLSRIEQVTTRLLALTRDPPTRLVAFDLADLVRETLRLLEVRMQNRGIDLRLHLDDVPKLRLDPLRLQEALFNVLDNAIAAVDGRPERRVEVRIRPLHEPFPGVCLDVVDTGVGVDGDTAAKVFDPFFSTKPVGEGTGLGLAIAKEVVEAHGGDIRFQSTLHQGTTVSILLPSQVDGGSA